MNRKTIIFTQPNVVELKEDAVPQVQPDDVQVKLRFLIPEFWDTAAQVWLVQ